MFKFIRTLTLRKFVGCLILIVCLGLFSMMIAAHGGWLTALGVVAMCVTLFAMAWVGGWLIIG